MVLDNCFFLGQYVIYGDYFSLILFKIGKCGKLDQECKQIIFEIFILKRQFNFYLNLDESFGCIKFYVFNYWV